MKFIELEWLSAEQERRPMLVNIECIVTAAPASDPECMWMHIAGHQSDVLVYMDYEKFKREIMSETRI